jgi:hypothetical protein
MGAQPKAGVIVVAVVVALAVGVGAGALLFKSSSTNSTASGTTAGKTNTTADTRPITLPANLAGLTDITTVMASHHPSATTLTRQRSHQVRVRSETEAAYSAAFGGAAAAYRQYSDSGLQKLPYVIAVRGSAPGLTIGPVIDAVFLGLATPEREVKTVGEVSCQIFWSPPTVAGRTPPPSSEIVTGCQRSSSGVTVFTGGGGGGFAGPAGLATMVNLTNAAWTAASAG